MPGFDSEKWQEKDAEATVKLGECQKKYGFPSGVETELLKIQNYPEAVWYILKPDYTTWLKYEKVMRDICADDADGDVVVTAHENVGGESTIYNGPQNIRDECQKTLNFALSSEYETFSGYYSTLKLETWGAREKRRKKWKKLILQELGILDLKAVGKAVGKADVKADVKVIIEKEGYSFVLDFHEKDAFEFAETPLFKKADWHSGAE